MTITTFFLFKAILTLASVAAILLFWRGTSAARWIWILGFLPVLASAITGTLYYAGIESMRPPSVFFAQQSNCLGALCFIVAAGIDCLTGLRAGDRGRVTRIVLPLLLPFAIAGLPAFGANLSIAAGVSLAIVAIMVWSDGRRVALLLLGAVVTSALATLAHKGMWPGLPMEPVNAYHLLLSVTMLCLGATALLPVTRPA